MKQLKNKEELFSITAELLKNRKRLIIAIDGRCASGKTTLGESLAAHFAGVLIHADDFFLQPHQRTAERLKEPGGNLDRERLLSEVLEPLKKGEDFSYSPFICSEMTLGKKINIKISPLTVIEGSYSCHPDLRKYYDLTIFMSVNKQLQLKRIRKRNGEEKLTVFEKKWIPLEERYFEAFGLNFDYEL